MKKISLWLKQDPYIFDWDGEAYYKASAHDEDNEHVYYIIWKILDDFDPSTDDDESNACDWDNPIYLYDTETAPHTNPYKEIEKLVWHTDEHCTVEIDRGVL